MDPPSYPLAMIRLKQSSREKDRIDLGFLRRLEQE
jgi:hypothetical protein